MVMPSSGRAPIDLTVRALCFLARCTV